MLIGTPYKDRGRTLEEGLDCLGLVLLRLGLPPGRSALEESMSIRRRSHLVATAEPGDVLAIPGRPVHLAFVEDRYHALEAVRELGVIRTPLSRLLEQGARIYRCS